MKKFSVTVIIPVYNGFDVLEDALQSLENQAYPIDEIILVEDTSTDRSIELLRKYQNISRLKVTLIEHGFNKGLAQSYNSALKQVKTTHVVLLMQDCLIRSKQGITKLMKPFLKDPTILVTCAKTINPLSVWKTYNFWQKCLMARHTGKILSGRNNSFCCYSYTALKKIGFFNSRRFRTAGEDTDMFHRIAQIGQIIDIDTYVEHLHNRNPHFGIFDYMKKENQRAEASGATVFFAGAAGLYNFIRIFTRPILLIGLIFPYLNIFSLFLIILYAFFYTKKVYLYELTNPRIILLPFIHILLLLSCTFYFFRGLTTGRQTL